MCETHDVAGQCTQECADLVNEMSPIPTLTEDPTGCSYPEPRPYEVAVYDSTSRSVVSVTVNPYDD